MDDYPEHLAPEFEESGAVKTPFDDWWSRVRHAFPDVPENVARYWLHEHWGHSPYSWIRSADYRFELIGWPADALSDIKSCWADWQHEPCVEHGKGLIEELGKPPFLYRTAVYMIEHGDFPVPIVVLDNRDGHLQRRREYRDECGDSIPHAHILIEGHRRFNAALYLQREGNLVPFPKVWVMTQAV